MTLETIGVNRVDKAFSSWMTDIFQGSDLNKIIEEMFAHMKTQIESPALANSRVRFDEVLFMDINFHQLNLTRGGSTFPYLIGWQTKGQLINPKNENGEECFKWAVIATLHHVEIKSNPERISRYVDNYDWGGLEFPLSIKGIGELERRNVSINLLAVEGKKVYILRRSKYESGKKVINKLLIDNKKWRHYTAIKSLSRLLKSSNTKHKCKQHFCMNCLQGFPTEISTSNIVKTMTQ